MDKGNTSGIGASYRDSEGELKFVTLGTIRGLTPLGTQLWAMYAPLRRAAVQEFDDIRLETDNFEAYMTIKRFKEGVPAQVFDIADQLDTLIRDDKWRCIVSYMYPSRNTVPRFLAKLGMKTCSRLYTFDRPVGGVEELLDWDQGMGIHHPDFMDVMIPSRAPDLMDFNVSLSLAEQIDDLGLGQTNAPQFDRMELEVDEMEDMMDGAVEDTFVGSIGLKRSLLENEPPFADID